MGRFFARQQDAISAHGFSPKLYNIQHPRLCIVPKNDVELAGRLH
jgi:hypothetical protein